jgi:hypothetical protein
MTQLLTIEEVLQKIHTSDGRETFVEWILARLNSQEEKKPDEHDRNAVA